jgi:hypothetical protein
VLRGPAAFSVIKDAAPPAEIVKGMDSAGDCRARPPDIVNRRIVAAKKTETPALAKLPSNVFCD